MANTKKVLTEEFTKAPQAQTAEDVNNQDAKTRLWQSLNTTYNNQMEESDQAYDKSISQQNNAMLARGMGRSSYAAQVAANMYNDKNTARNKLGQALIADYQNRIGEIEQQEQENEWRNKEWNYKLERDAVADKRYEDETAYARGRDAVADQRYADETAYARGRDALADQRYEDETAYSRKQDELNRAFTEKQWKAQQDQWKQEFNYNEKTTEQKLNYETVMYALQNGKDVSDDMLKKAGISRADFNSMKAAASAGGGRSASKPKGDTPPNDDDVNGALGSSSKLKYIADVSHANAADFKAGASNTVGKNKIGTTSTSAAPFIAGASKAVINDKLKKKND